MKSVIFTICLMGLFLFFAGCSDSSAKRQSRLDFSNSDRYGGPRQYDPFYPASLQVTGIPKIKPMELSPERLVEK